MKIAVVSINYWPESTGIAAFATYRAEYLRERGHQVSVYTTFPYYPQWKKRREDRHTAYKKDSHNGVDILRSYAYIPCHVNSIKRILHEISFITSSFFAMLAGKRPDILFVISPPLGLSISAWIISRMWRVPYIYDVQDLQPDSASELKMLPDCIVSMLYKLERFAYCKSTMVTTLTEGMRKKIIDKGISPDKVRLIEPKIDSRLCGTYTYDGNKFRDKYNLCGKFIVVHTGNMGAKQGLEVVIETARLCEKDDSICFLLIGDGVDRRRLEGLSLQYGLNNVRFFPVLSDHHYIEVLRGCDVALVVQHKSVSEIAFPSKVVTYMASGCAILASVNSQSEIARTILDAECGAVVRPESALDMYRGLMEMRSRNIRELGYKSREYAVNRWNADRVMKEMEKNIEYACRKSV